MKDLPKTLTIWLNATNSLPPSNMQVVVLTKRDEWVMARTNESGDFYVPGKYDAEFTKTVRAYVTLP